MGRIEVTVSNLESGAVVGQHVIYPGGGPSILNVNGEEVDQRMIRHHSGDEIGYFTRGAPGEEVETQVTAWDTGEKAIKVPLAGRELRFEYKP